MVNFGRRKKRYIVGIHPFVEVPTMDVLNPIGLVLGIISSALSIYAFVQKRMRAAPAGAPHRPARAQAMPRPQASAAMADAPATPSATGSSGLRLRHVTAAIWGLLGFGCLSEGLLFGEPVLLIFGGGFLLLARYCWRG